MIDIYDHSVWKKSIWGGNVLKRNMAKKSAPSDSSVYPPVTPSLIFIKKKLLHTIRMSLKDNGTMISP